ncbi:DUF5992 family protein [Vibrio sp. Isolate24]|uniref:DUF5992 family protein n=1 Tax=Vibrio sp. Isolate24 TaxID=2908534 RepID=UPI001EFE17BF|nr:DUF5992 family protein [Vibrio sp. Isolate24]MCG9679190.1 DUF5992 family protein [Vibrio sp. Isolate24]
MMIRGIAFLTLVALSNFALASGAFIAEGSTIESIANTYNNTDSFSISVKGGTGVCGNTTILFPRNATTSSEVHNRAYSTALTAFSMGAKVKVYNYIGRDCKNASYIEIVR